MPISTGQGSSRHISDYTEHFTGLAITQHPPVELVIFGCVASERALPDSENEQDYGFAMSSLLIRLPSDLSLTDKKSCR